MKSLTLVALFASILLHAQIASAQVTLKSSIHMVKNELDGYEEILPGQFFVSSSTPEGKTFIAEKIASNQLGAAIKKAKLAISKSDISLLMKKLDKITGKKSTIHFEVGFNSFDLESSTLKLKVSLDGDVVGAYFDDATYTVSEMLKRAVEHHSDLKRLLEIAIEVESEKVKVLDSVDGFSLIVLPVNDFKLA